MRRQFLVSLCLTLFLLMAYVTPAAADGIIIPDPLPPICPGGKCPTVLPPIPPFPRPIAQLVIRYHRVAVNIEDQIAVTRVDQVFYNPNDRQLEGTYIFPLPVEAVVSNFKLWIDGKPVEGKVLSAEEARRTYESIIRDSRDPALLEYVGRGAVQARIFPIAPRGERRIELEYSQALKVENGLVKYVYPLNTEKFSTQPLESVSVTVSVKSRQAIRAVYSPTHQIDVQRNGDYQFKASYEANRVKPDIDFGLYYSVGQTEAFHLLTYRDPGDTQDPDGFFMMMLAPQPGVMNERKIDKDLLLVLDRSGSMEGEKFRQAQSALKYILQHLNPGDRFHVISFSSTIESYANQLRPASEAVQAIAWAERLGSAGSTDINRALLESIGVASRERPTYLIFMTDGLPTAGETKSLKILSNFAAAAPKNLRLFAFGVGYDVDTLLLDSLSQEHHGLSQYVKPGEKLDEVLSGFYAGISTPVLANLELDFGRLPVYDLYPSPLPDLFEGTQVIVVGRYRQSGTVDVMVSGKVNNEPVSFRYPQQRFTEDSQGESSVLNSLPRLWATRKIGYLLNKIRISGPDKESIDQIVRLSIRYGIVTPYTSYLVTENAPLGVEDQKRLSDRVYQATQAAPSAPSSGQAAVEKAAGQGEMQRAQVAPTVPASVSQTVRQVGSRTFVYKNGVWVDTTYDPKLITIKIPFLSVDYFTLANKRQDIGAALALGERVIVIVDGKAYEVVTSSEPAQQVTILPSTTTPIARNTPIGPTPVSTQTKPPLQTTTVRTTPTVPVPANFPPCGGALLPLGAVIVFGALHLVKGRRLGSS